MTQLISVSQCADIAGLSANEIVLGVVPSTSHRSLYESYLLFLHMGRATVRDRIVSDIRMALDLGAKKRAAELFIVLRRFLSDERESAKVVRMTGAARGRCAERPARMLRIVPASTLERRTAEVFFLFRCVAERRPT